MSKRVLAEICEPRCEEILALVDQELERQKTQAGLETQKVAQAQAGVNLQDAQLKLQNQQRLNDLGSKLAGAKDQKERDAISQTILAMMGKDKPE